ncbi:malectin domain-containing carbohydrate-binding protein [Dermatophilus congolensis]|uniref:Di-glucose binding within endoplasmic reticulum n=1 Tax=Dermatophilus congolensis TaxID=1863 RepID=A0A239VDH3_9MICO|nr:malectin domain-containing carbohydrate-binding protein [Dermatophilus congolensis]MBO3128721.1 hypothetical protein [Dermatophilus congolensis]MBO3132642.1 hypothetical protein [Dermatophilus congolensis]MBO3133197.1 hypothetical protein [Dermatophilus congolensis]MBO3135432.1 hypothetical protein [Dermatophilus congolensis]MBO3137672.1 hypothetical protein [Dermatophilus congolensis]
MPAYNTPTRTAIALALAGTITSAAVTPGHATQYSAAPAATATTTNTIRLAARTTSRVDPAGNTWKPMYTLRGTPNYRIAPASQPITNTNDPDLYRYEVYGLTGTTIPLPTAGRYNVTIATAEPYWKAKGKRVFDITAEGATVVDDLDIYATAGYSTAHNITFTTNVTDGALDLKFLASVDKAIIAGITITPAAPSAPAPAPSTATPHNSFTSRMVASPTPVTDKSGNVWNRWSATLGTNRVDRGLRGIDIQGTDDDEVYRTYVQNPRGYALDVPGKGRYKVRLAMVENTYWNKGGRVFDVLAEDTTVVKDIDITAAVGPRTAYDVTFETNVTDGILDLTFRATAGTPTISAIEVTSATTLTSYTTVERNYPGLPFPLYPGSVYATDISNAPLAANAQAVGDYIARQAATRYDGYAGFNNREFTTAMHVAEPGTPRIDIIHSCAVDWGVPSNLFDGAAHFRSVPVPANAIPAAGSDGEMSIYDPATDQLWEFWKMSRDSKNRWQACWGGRIDNFSTHETVFPDGFGASASGMAISPGMITLDDIRRGRIDHAIALAVPTPSGLGYSWPANRTDGTSTDPNAPYEGQRLRLPANLDLDRYNLTPAGRIIAEAAKKYGFIVTDNAGAVAVTAESSRVITAQTGKDPWSAYLGSDAWSTMRDFPWTELEALPVNYGKR